MKTTPFKCHPAFASLIGFVAGICSVSLAAESEFSAEHIEFFEAKVRPVLATHCYECHSGKSKTLKGGLRLDGRQFALKGGESGTAVVLGKPDESLVVQAVRWESSEMPPKGKLKPDQVAALVKWIELGAPWPDEDSAPTVIAAKTYDWPRIRRKHWAWRPVEKHIAPVVKKMDWVKNEIDRFVLAKLEDAKLQPVAAASPRVLVRRMYLDLIGLPPTPKEVEDFVKAATSDRQAAVEACIDKLLESRHYGERWGRHWLDVARYSDGYGGFLDKDAFPQAWRYRDWVVDALNRDLPFNQFVKMQIAGDLLGEPDGALATGFFALGPTYRSDGGDPDSVAQAKGETLDDRVDTFSRGLLGLTVSCARCHEHKFDPIPQMDYYSIAGIFNNTRIGEAPLVPNEVVKKHNDHQNAIRQLDGKIKQRNNQFKKEKRQPNDQEKQEIATWQKELENLRKTAPPKYDTAHALFESGSGNMSVAIRGNLRKPGEQAPRRFLRVLAGENPAPFTQGSGRLELAEATVDPDNPLTARVFVNRVWLHHFGRALVRSPSNFGTLGEEPTHPKLLDWLTAAFIESGWSIKQLHRTIMSSSSYQLSSQFDDRNFQTDGDNQLIWRMNPRRLDVESWRDALLTVTGELDRKAGGPSTDNIDVPRRTLYFKVSRNGDQFRSDQFLRLFDFPLMRATVAKRPASIVPQQFLFMMNSPFMISRAKALAARLEREAKTDEEQIDLAYQLLYGRAPRDEEKQVGLSFFQLTENPVKALSPWQQYAQVLLSSNEFMYVQ